MNDLILDPDNLRKHPDRNKAMIRASLEEVGAGRSILVDGDNIVRAGNGVFEQARELGLKVRVVEAAPDELIAVKRTDLVGEKAIRAAILDNRAGETSEWDAEALLALAKDQPELVGDIFTERELMEIAKGAGINLRPDPVENGDGESPVGDQLREKWKVESGQLWHLGDHLLICGDCTDKTTIERVMGKDKATLLFTDPPYGVSIGAKNRLLNSVQKAGRNLTDIESDQMGSDDLSAMLTQAFSLAKEFLTDDCSVFVCAPQGGSLGLMMMMMMMQAGLEVRHVLNWVKNAPTFSLGRLDYEYQHEPILFTWTKTHKRYGAGSFQTSVWNVDKPRHSLEHPTMKPVELPINAILNHTDRGDIVYEPFCGSGTDIIACEMTGRKCRAIEIAPEYVAVSIQRWVDMTGGVPELVN